MSTAGATDQGFFAFYREYTHTGIHAASTAGLTAFGLLTFVHRAFVVLAIGVYVLPPIYLYLTRDEGSVETVEPSDSDAHSGPGSSAPSEATDSAEATGSTTTTGTVDSTDTRPGSTESMDREEVTDSPDAAVSAAGPSNDRSRANAIEEDDGAAEPAAGSSGVERTPRTGAERTDDGPADDPADGIDTTVEEGAEASADSDGGGTHASGGVERRGSRPPASEDVGDDRSGAEGPGPRAEGTTAAEPTTDAPAEREWVEADSPTDETLSDVVASDSTAYAVGAGGVVLAREGGWETVLEHGPAAESNALGGVDVTDDGNAVWFTGDSGALGRYDVEAGRHTDHSAPAGLTDNWVDVAVAGPAGEERIYLVNGSGQVLAGAFDGSEVKWGEPVKPGSGSSMSAIEFAEDVGYCCDTNSGVYETTDGEEFERIGIENGGGSFTALAAAGPEELAVADADGTVQRYDGSVWTPLRAADVALDALSTDGRDWLAAGDGGTIRELVEGSWEPRETPVETNLHGVAVVEPSVAVGAEGTIIERRPAEDGD